MNKAVRCGLPFLRRRRNEQKNEIQNNRKRSPFEDAVVRSLRYARSEKCDLLKTTTFFNCLWSISSDKYRHPHENTGEKLKGCQWSGFGEPESFISMSPVSGYRCMIPKRIPSYLFLLHHFHQVYQLIVMQVYACCEKHFGARLYMKCWTRFDKQYTFHHWINQWVGLHDPLVQGPWQPQYHPTFKLWSKRSIHVFWETASRGTNEAVTLMDLAWKTAQH